MIKICKENKIECFLIVFDHNFWAYLRTQPFYGRKTFSGKSGTGQFMVSFPPERMVQTFFFLFSLQGPNIFSFFHFKVQTFFFSFTSRCKHGHVSHTRAKVLYMSDAYPVYGHMSHAWPFRCRIRIPYRCLDVAYVFRVGV